MAGKITRQTRTELSASVADLGSVSRLHFDNFNSSSFSFVLDEALQLAEAPVAYPVVHPSSSVSFPDSFEVFQDNLVSVEIGNNVLAYSMINPSHEPLLPARNLPKKTLGRSSAFGLENGTQVLESSFDLLGFVGIIKPAVTCDSKIIYSEVYAKNSLLQSRAVSNDLFGECEQEEASAFLVDSQKALAHFPSEISLETVRNGERHFNSAINCGEGKDMVFEVGRTGEVIPDRSINNYRFCLRFLDNPASLLDAGTGELALQTQLSQSLIDERMELDVIPYLLSPSSIDTKLQPISVGFDSLNYLRCCLNLDFNCDSTLHNNRIRQEVFKCLEVMAFPPRLKSWVSCHDLS